MPDLDHLVASGFTAAQDFASTRTGFNAPSPDRDRANWGGGLLRQIERINIELAQLRERRAANNVAPDLGVAISLEISPPGALDAAKLEWKRDGIELLNVTTPGSREVITVYVPDGRLSAFETRIRAYLERDGPPRKDGRPSRPAHANLINAIASFRRAAFVEFWTDTAPIPPDGDMAAYQVWLRLGHGTSAQRATEFREAVTARNLDIVVHPGHLTFPGRVVLAVQTTRAVLESSLELLDLIAEIRMSAPSATFFMAELRPFEQAEWVGSLVDRLTKHPATNTPFVTLLDTGVNHGHPLLAPYVAEADLHAVGEGWTVTDHEGHGSNMAGLALHGDLRRLLDSSDPHTVPHRLESVKILPDSGENPKSLYGWTAQEAVRLVETAAVDRRRTFSMMTTADGATAGMPSEWSAAIDRLTFGLRDPASNPLDLPPIKASLPQINPRLFVLSAGNIPWDRWIGYPGRNDLEEIEDPGQSWNALTVGAFTDQIDFDQESQPSYTVIAPRGALSPCSRTSLTWPGSWPNKPDVVAEGGNGCIDARMNQSVVVGPEDLRLLTTSHNPATTMLAESGDTSAATAEVARICSHLHTRYPAYWPETIRALVVHGARYTPRMTTGNILGPAQRQREVMVSRFGHGRAQLETAVNSALSRPTVVLQETIVPYVKEGSQRKLGQVNMHNLPWPREMLQALAETTVTLRVTLSYFIQPNPSRRGWQSKFRYQSFGLRYAVRGASETSERFRQRVNKIDRDAMGEDRERTMPDPDNEGWALRSTLRSRGSIHSDAWTGTAADLANKSEIAVFPVGGWWKDIGASLGEDVRVRYALVVSLEVLSDADVNIYAPIAAEIAARIPVTVGRG